MRLLCCLLLVAPVAAAWSTLAASRRAAAVPSALTMMAASRLEDLKVYELKAVCRAKGLKVSGRKAELVERILEAGPGGDADSSSVSAVQAASAEVGYSRPAGSGWHAAGGSSGGVTTGEVGT